MKFQIISNLQTLMWSIEKRLGVHGNEEKAYFLFHLRQMIKFGYLVQTFLVRSFTRELLKLSNIYSILSKVIADQLYNHSMIVWWKWKFLKNILQIKERNINRKHQLKVFIECVIKKDRKKSNYPRNHWKRKGHNIESSNFGNSTTSGSPSWSWLSL